MCRPCFKNPGIEATRNVRALPQDFPAMLLGSGQGIPDFPSEPKRHSERPTRGHPARLGSRNPTFCSKYVPLGLLQEARAKLARQQVQSERPGLPAGAFAFGGVRTRLCDKGLHARRSLGVGQRRGAARALDDRRGARGGLSLGASRDSSGPRCLWLTLGGAVMSRRS